jgi:hypothetical protein
VIRSRHAGLEEPAPCLIRGHPEGVPTKVGILMEPFILRYGKFNTNPTDTPIPLLTSPLKGEEHNDFPPLRDCVVIREGEEILE